MKGYVYYSSEDSIRNSAFIDDLINEAKAIGIKLQLLVDNEQPSADAKFILFRGRNFDKAKSFEREGFHVFNRSEVNKIANNKLRTFELATLLGIPAVPTRRICVIDEIEAYPVVLKTVDGHGGSEVILATTVEQAELFFSKFNKRELIIQPYIESGSQDIRVFMLGQVILGAVKRTGKDSFKSNYTLGGSVENYTLSSYQETEVITIARALKSNYIGIDFLLLPDGRWLLNEVEDPVGARSFYKVYNISIARMLIDYIKLQITSI